MIPANIQLHRSLTILFGGTEKVVTPALRIPPRPANREPYKMVARLHNPSDLPAVCGAVVFGNGHNLCATLFGWGHCDGTHLAPTTYTEVDRGIDVTKAGNDLHFNVYIPAGKTIHVEIMCWVNNNTGTPKLNQVPEWPGLDILEVPE